MIDWNSSQDWRPRVPELNFLIRRVRLIVVLFLVIAIGASAAILLRPSTYEASMKFLVRNARADMVMTSDRSSVSAGQVSEAEMNSEIELLNGRDLLEEVALQTLLSGELETASQEEREGAIRALEGNLDVAAVRRANVISVTYTGHSPGQALEVLRQLSKRYLEKHLTAHRTPGAYGFFKAQADRYKEELERVERQLSVFRNDHQAVSVDGQKDLLVRRNNELQVQLGALNASVRETRERITRLREATDSMQSTVLAQTRAMPSQAATERLTTMLVEMKNRRSELLAKFQPDDRAVKQADQEIRDTQAALDAIRQERSYEQTTGLNPVRESLLSDLADAEVQLAGLTAKRWSISTENKGVWDQISVLEASTPEYESLEREQKVAAANFQLYETKREEARVAEALDQEKITNVSVAQNPTVSYLPSGPNKAMLLAMGVCLALFISVAVAFGVDELFAGETVRPEFAEQPRAAEHYATGYPNGHHVLLLPPDVVNRQQNVRGMRVQ